MTLFCFICPDRTQWFRFRFFIVVIDERNSVNQRTDFLPQMLFEDVTSASKKMSCAVLHHFMIFYGPAKDKINNTLAFKINSRPAGENSGAIVS